MFYDEKGIKYTRIESRPAKIPENEFAPINECFDDDLTDYCAFWCAETFGLTAAKCIYQIAAVKVRNGQIADEFHSLIRPWDGTSCRKDAARKANLDLSVIESAEDVDQVMQKFFAFVGSDVLVSTGALGNQAKLISRAARYTGMKEITNEFFDILDLAADTSPELDMENNTREFLLSYFEMKEGHDALEKAKNNKKLYDALMNYGA
jgi:DNA polymerase III alpha subunit (gram-positive type)